MPRRVVTGHDAQGRSTILMDGDAPNSRVLTAAGGIVRTELWENEAVPADNTGGDDAARGIDRLLPPPGGAMFRVIEYPPDSVRLKNIDPARHFGHAADTTGKRHPGMHKTDTIDYVVVLSGEIWAVMESGEAVLRAGDSLVQRGTNHAWSNRTERPCVLAFVMIAAKPLD